MRSLIPVASLALWLGPALSAQQDKAPPKEPAASQPKAAAAFSVGEPVDAKLELRDLDGKVHTLNEYRGKVVVVAFWSIKCPALKNAEPKLIQIHADYHDKNVVLLAINANQDEIGLLPDPAPKDAKPEAKATSYAPLRKHIEAKDVKFPVFVDHANQVSKRFKAQTTPHSFVIDSTGVLRYDGALDDDPQNKKNDDATRYVRDAVDALLAGKKVSVASTKPYG